MVKKEKNTWCSMIVLICLALALGGCGAKQDDPSSGDDTNSQDKTPILIGFSVPLTGASAKGGQDMENGAQMAIDAINAAGGVSGRPVQLMAIDDGCEPQQAVQAGNKLVSQGVVAVVGYYCSGAANATLPVYDRAKMPVVLAAATATNLTHQGYQNIFRIQGNTDQQGMVAAKTMLEGLKAKKIAVINDNTTYSRGLAESTVNWLKQLDAAAVVQTEEITPGEKDFSSVVTKVKAFKPDAIYFTGYYAEGSIIIKQLHSLGVNAQFLAGDANNDPTFIAVAGADAEGVIFTSPPMVEGLPAASKFIEDYKTRYNMEPAAYAVYSYDGINLVVDALKRANSTEGTAVIDALRKTDNFVGITSTMSFDERGDLTTPGIVTLTIKDGKFVPY